MDEWMLDEKRLMDGKIIREVTTTTGGEELISGLVVYGVLVRSCEALEREEVCGRAADRRMVIWL